MTVPRRSSRPPPTTVDSDVSAILTDAPTLDFNFRVLWRLRGHQGEPTQTMFGRKHSLISLLETPPEHSGLGALDPRIFATHPWLFPFMLSVMRPFSFAGQTVAYVASPNEEPAKHTIRYIAQDGSEHAMSIPSILLLHRISGRKGILETIGATYPRAKPLSIALHTAERLAGILFLRSPDLPVNRRYEGALTLTESPGTFA